MFEEYLAAILAGIGFARMGWLLLEWRPAARLGADD
jgi:hypothetical protein